MKKGFTLIEAMVAIVVIFVGFGAIVAMGLSAVSNANVSKAKLRATDVATGILEEYRAARDANGVAGLKSMAQPAPATIEGVTYTPVVTVYNLDSNSVIVETTVNWTVKKSASITSRVYLINNSTRFATIAPGTITYPTWYLTPTP